MQFCFFRHYKFYVICFKSHGYSRKGLTLLIINISSNAKVLKNMKKISEKVVAIPPTVETRGLPCNDIRDFIINWFAKNNTSFNKS